MRDQVAIEPTEFEHVLLISANLATRIVDGVLWVAGVDPHGFRLCHNWYGDSFTCVAVNGVLHGTTASEPIFLPRKNKGVRRTKGSGLFVSL